MSLKGKVVSGGEVCWLHFNTTLGQPQCGDYGYQKAYAPNRSEKIEDGETYVKVKILDVMWKYDAICFNIITVNKDGSESYKTQVDDADRLTLI
jgi:hypothetical protein